jgi:hypothetical protein
MSGLLNWWRTIGNTRARSGGRDHAPQIGGSCDPILGGTETGRDERRTARGLP